MQLHPQYAPVRSSRLDFAAGSKLMCSRGRRLGEFFSSARSLHMMCWYPSLLHPVLTFSKSDHHQLHREHPQTLHSTGSSRMPKPTILLVGGAWHTADYLKPLATALEAADYPTLTLALPSVGASPPKLDFGDDVALVRSTASELVCDGKDSAALLWRCCWY